MGIGRHATASTYTYMGLVQVYKDLMASQEQELEALRNQMIQRNQQDASLTKQLRDSKDRLQASEAPFSSVVCKAPLSQSLSLDGLDEIDTAPGSIY